MCASRVCRCLHTSRCLRELDQKLRFWCTLDLFQFPCTNSFAVDWSNVCLYDRYMFHAILSIHYHMIYQRIWMHISFSNRCFFCNVFFSLSLSSTVIHRPISRQTIFLTPILDLSNNRLNDDWAVQKQEYDEISLTALIKKTWSFLSASSRHAKSYFRKHPIFEVFLWKYIWLQK